MPYLEVRKLEKNYGDFTLSASFGVEEGEFLSIIGPSGSGKSTLLSLIAGLEMPDGGTITLGGKDITKERIQDRGIGMVFQEYTLFPSMNVEKNVQFGMKRKEGRKEATTALLELVGQILLEGVQGLELGDVLGKLVVHLGADGVLDLLDLDLKDHVLAGQLGHIVLGEGDVQVLLLAGLHAHHLLLEAGDEGAGAQFQAVIDLPRSGHVNENRLESAVHFFEICPADQVGFILVFSQPTRSRAGCAAFGQCVNRSAFGRRFRPSVSVNADKKIAVIFFRIFYSVLQRYSFIFISYH